MTFDLTDQGLITRALSAQSQRNGVPADELRANVIAAVDRDEALFPRPEARSAVAAFIKNGGTLHIAFVTPEPVTIPEMIGAGPASLVGSLSISATPPSSNPAPASN
ncbi:MAG TPA: hypothetical protein VMI52_12595 [Acetobacteraceae bacterium]|nr:hypothetical protein [Acetobacteraceae bacterium]